jgi:hypothetical protein
MSTHEKAPIVSEGAFSYLDLYTRATKILLRKSTDRLFMMRIRQQAGQNPGLLAFGNNMAGGNLPRIKREDHFYRRPRDTISYGRFIISNGHLEINPGDDPYVNIGTPLEQHELLVRNAAALHLLTSAPDFSGHYDLFYPEKLRPGQRLHSTIYPLDPTEQQYHTPQGWPQDQPVLYRVTGSGHMPVSDLNSDFNIVQLYNALGETE